MEQIKSKRPLSNNQNNNNYADDNNSNTNMDDYMMNIWQEDFCPVAQRLLERIQTHQSEFETL